MLANPATLRDCTGGWHLAAATGKGFRLFESLLLLLLLLGCCSLCVEVQQVNSAT